MGKIDTECFWLSYKFIVYYMQRQWNNVAGIYIFAGINSQNQWVPYYISQCDSFLNTMPSNEIWRKAQNIGATHVHAMAEYNLETRMQIEQHLIQSFKPPLNKQQLLDLLKIHTTNSQKGEIIMPAMTKQPVENKIKQLLDSMPEIPADKKNNALTTIINHISEYISENLLDGRLKILFEYEKHYLTLIKEYKEEIKFAHSIQEDLRRERSQFFSQILKEVSETLKKSDVESSVASKWIQELVDSYTKSINLSSDLADIHAIDVIGKIRERAKKEVNIDNIDKGIEGR